MKRNLIQLVCGVLLAVTALMPVVDLQLPELDAFFVGYLDSGQQAAEQGRAMAEDERLGRIKLRLEAYILDKAASIDCDILPEILLNGDGNPVSVQISGEYSDAERQLMETMITNDLGIPKEDQQWTGVKRRTP